MEQDKPTSKMKEIDQYHCIKLPFKNILHKHPQNYTITFKHTVDKEYTIQHMDNNTLLALINDAVIRTNKITIKTYLLLRYWVLSQYYSDHKIPLITEEMIGSAIKSICSPKGETGKVRKTETLLLIQQFQDLDLFQDQMEDGSHLNQILDYQKRVILTAIENNVRAHFPNYLRKYVNIVMEHLYPKQLEDKVSKKKFYTEIKKIKNDLLLNRDPTHYTCDPKYHGWLQERRDHLLPPITQGETYYYDVHVEPQKYLKYMIYMNNEIHQLGGSMFQFFPLQTDVIPKHIIIDTKALIELLVAHGTKDMLANIGECQDSLWKTYFNI